MQKMRPTSNSLSTGLLKWYDRHHRSLPWRLPRGSPPSTVLDPYHSLVSEAMLQQTQVATVIPYFHSFVDRFPTVQSLADSDLQEVLRLWQGLGYYSRAKNLRAAARKIVEEFAGKIPSDLEELLSLPGVGRYTAGAIRSIAFNQPAPILDGNVARVLCRLDGILGDPKTPAVRALLWERARAILPGKRVGDFNSALMELGALICTPKSPNCHECPVKSHCKALAAGMQDRIPPPRKAKAIPLIHRSTVCIRHGQRYLIEQRPATGRWAGMWQFITFEEKTASAATLKARTHLEISSLRRLGTINHNLTHRRYEFAVFVCDAKNVRSAPKTNSTRKWLTLEDLERFPVPRPHLRIVELLRENAGLSS